MFIKELALKNFRNYKNLLIEFSPQINLIEGANAAGKTNILEAISVISGLKSFRNISDQDMVKWGEESYFCSSVIGDSEFEKFEIGFSQLNEKIKKRAKIDGTARKKISDYYGKFLTVIFSPEDINLITGPPDIRRKYFDSIISKTDPEYLNSLSDYKKILISRNRLLRDIRETKRKRESELDIWDGMFAAQVSVIVRKRNEFLDGFNLSFTDAYMNISEKDDSPDIRYICTLDSFDAESIVNKLKKQRDRDIILASTQCGPHRDDYGFLFKKNMVYKYYASQGQKRTASVSLKSAELEYLKKETDQKPVILIDDIFGDLDDKRRKKMIDILIDNGQIIITAVNSGLMPDCNADIRKFFVSDGEILY